MKYKHVPVMLDEVIEYLAPQEGDIIIDCTLGGGGYTMEILNRVGNSGNVLSIDADMIAINNQKKRIINNKIRNNILVNDNFGNLAEIIEENLKDKEINGIVFDLGISSAQLDDEERGFSFNSDAPLKMEFGESSKNKTVDIINEWSLDELTNIIREFGEERFARGIAKGIVEARNLKKIETTAQLVEIISANVPKSYRYNKRLHFATRTFQALRIATNDELESIRKALDVAIDSLSPKGRVVVVSFHSLEDRIVKHLFRTESKDCICPSNYLDCQCNHKAKVKIINKKIIIPSDSEVNDNPRARSAKMRVAEKI